MEERAMEAHDHEKQTTVRAAWLEYDQGGSFQMDQRWMILEKVQPQEVHALAEFEVVHFLDRDHEDQVLYLLVHLYLLDLTRVVRVH